MWAFSHLLTCYFMLFAADSTFLFRSLLLHDLRGDKLHFAAQHLERLVDVAQGVAKILLAFYTYFKPKSAIGDHPLSRKNGLAIITGLCYTGIVKSWVYKDLSDEKTL